ncbi:hypothetical protein GGU10DRAFT_414740 [Lentinula aff. detonsa]|uniref:Ubiquitin-like protease family profile domain-containing protein n=1 Tax=Lentinula aff. detonsa TaxID=2804958 RepID=A0AA38NDS0_9AGAR|nr:hypothetical protein GGU10DRAFT_414740 [Lentinula aff. detonsa]
MTTSTWSTATKDEQKCATIVFRIPPQAKRTLFPSRRGSIWDLLEFELPSSTPSLPPPTDYNQFFSSLTPSDLSPDLLDKLWKLPLPAVQAIQQLNNLSREHWMKGAKSVLYSHVTGEETLFPLWVISYWNNFCSEAEQTYQSLAAIPWRGRKEGFADCLPIYTLWRILGKNWLDSTVVDNALEVLQAAVDDSQKLTSKFIVWPTHVVEKVVQFFGGEEEKLEEYSKCDWLTSIAREVFEGEKMLVSIAHLGKLPPRKDETVGLDHWVPIVVDGKDHRFLYADSLCGKKQPIMPPKLVNALERWKSHHTLTRFTLATITISPQNNDSSCGPCAINAVKHFILPTTVNIIKPSLVPALRLQTMSKIINHIHENSSNESVASVSEDSGNSEVEDGDCVDSTCKFTFRMLLPSSTTSCSPSPAPSDTPTSISYTPHDAPDPVSKVACQSLVNFLVDVTPEERAEATKCEFERMKNEWELKQERQEKADHEKLLDKREKGKQRQQAYRDRKKAQKVATGDNSQQKKRKLQGIDDEDEQSDLAEGSRPQRQLKQDIKDGKRDSHMCGRKPTKAPKKARNYNYMQPIIWAQIEAAARKAGKPWSPKWIVETAQKMNPQLFRRLTPQVLGRWTNDEAKSRGEYRWKASVLEKVKHGNAPGGHTTRRGILDSVPEVCEMIKKQLKGI